MNIHFCTIFFSWKQKQNKYTLYPSSATACDMIDKLYLTYFSLMMNMCIFELGHHWLWLIDTIDIDSSGPIHYLSQCKIILLKTTQNHQHIEALTKWPTSCSRHFQMKFIEWKCVNFSQMSLKFVPSGPVNNMSTLVQIMACRRTGDKPLSEPMLTLLRDHMASPSDNELKEHLSNISCFLLKKILHIWKMSSVISPPYWYMESVSVDITKIGTFHYLLLWRQAYYGNHLMGFPKAGLRRQAWAASHGLRSICPEAGDSVRDAVCTRCGRFPASAG